MDFLIALIALLLFIPYTKYHRWFEIGCGIIAWLNILIIMYAIC